MHAHSHRHARNIATGKRKSSTKDSLHKIKGCLHPYIIIYTAKTCLCIHYTTFFPSNWSRSHLNSFASQHSLSVSVICSLGKGKQPESKPHRALVATAAIHQEQAKFVCNGICVIARMCAWVCVCLCGCVCMLDGTICSLFVWSF